MKINASIAANFFLLRAQEEKRPLTLLKLLKLLFIAHGLSLALIEGEEGMLNGEKFEAWSIGTVIPSIYYEFRDCKNNPIKFFSKMSCDSESCFEYTYVFLESVDSNLSSLREILEFVWDTYKNHTQWQLSQKAHEEGSPWRAVYEEGVLHKEINNDLIKKYYQSILGHNPTRAD